MLLWAGLTLLAVAFWPLQWHERFRLEQRFGVNTNRGCAWWADRAKGLALAAALGVPTLAGLLVILGHGGTLGQLQALAGNNLVDFGPGMGHAGFFSCHGSIGWSPCRAPAPCGIGPAAWLPVPDVSPAMSLGGTAASTRGM